MKQGCIWRNVPYLIVGVAMLLTLVSTPLAGCGLFAPKGGHDTPEQAVLGFYRQSDDPEDAKEYISPKIRGTSEGEELAMLYEASKFGGWFSQGGAQYFKEATSTSIEDLEIQPIEVSDTTAIMHATGYFEPYAYNHYFEWRQFDDIVYLEKIDDQWFVYNIK